MKRPKVYLETTLFNFYLDKERDAHVDTVRLFTEIAEGKYDAFTSSAVMDELSKAPAGKSAMMMALVTEYGVEVLPVSEEAKKLADAYVAEGIIPLRYKTDGIHIAMATACGLDFIVSLNFKHIVKFKTIIMANAINALNGYRSINIVTPMEIIDNEDA